MVWRKGNSAGDEARWIATEASKIIGKKSGKAMSYSRAEKIIGQGCGGWQSPNSMWWRGVSVASSPTPISPIPTDHAENRRDDEYYDFALLKASGQVRDKRGNVIRIDNPHTDFTALDRDRLFQAYVAWRAGNPAGDEARWIANEATKIIGKKSGKAMSPKRAEDVIGQGCAGWESPNSMWWRGVSVK